jgi:lysozyme family protein
MARKTFSFAELKDDYTNLWNTMTIREERRSDLAKAAKKITDDEAQANYRKVMERTGVPVLVVGIIHSLEGGNNFKRHLHNGDPLSDRTVNDPSGRPPTGSPPFDWVDSAVDALTSHHLDTVGDWPVERIAFQLEKYNGFGYRDEHPEVKSPYLWSFTNHFTKGKFTRDHHFEAGAGSDQAGGMALLKLLTEGGAKVESAVTTDTAKTIPLVSTLFFAEKPFELLPSATAAPANDPDVVELEEPSRKIGEVGQLWEIEVQSKNGPKRHGFARASLFKNATKDPAVDVDNFAQLCLNAARFSHTSAHHLVALADVETGIRNVAAASGDGVGPFLIKAADWDAAIAGGTSGFNSTSRLDPFAQPFVAAIMAADAAKALQSTIPGRLPTSAELYIAHLVGSAHAAKVLSNPTVTLESVVTAELGGAESGIVSALRPWLFTAGIDVKSALEKIARRMDFGYARADGIFARIEPGMQMETAPATGFASRLLDKATSEWDFFGKQTRNAAGKLTHAGHKETEARVPAGSGEDWFARVGVYWREGAGRAGLDGRNDDVPWSAAFISYVVKQANPAGRFHASAQHSVYISQAIRDFIDKKEEAGYWCKRLNEHQPKVGDIICWAREDGVDYDHQKGGDYAGHTDIVVEVRPGEIDVIGGNVGDSVTRRTFACDAGGFLKGGKIQDELLFGIMENRIP